MKHFRTILISCAAVLSALSCSDDDMDPVAIDGGILSDNEIEMSPTGSSFSIAYTSLKAWKIVGCPSWITPNRREGSAGTTTLVFNTALNSERTDRDDEIRISAIDGSSSTSIRVKQPYPYLRINSEDVADFTLEHLFEYSESNGTGNGILMLPIESNVMWRIEEVEEHENPEYYGLEYFSLTTEEGENDCDFNIIPKNENFSKEPYSVVFNIVPIMYNSRNEKVEIPEEAADRYTVMLTQDNFLFLLNGSADPVDIDIDDLNSNTPVSISIEAESPWIISESPDWIVTDTDSGQNIVLNISADGVSPARESRSGVIRLLADEGNVTRDIAVTQDGYLFEVEDPVTLEPVDHYMIPSDNVSEHTLSLRTRGPWEILNIPEWLEVTPSSCNEVDDDGQTMITVRCRNENLEFEDMIANLVFTRQIKPDDFSGTDQIDVDLDIVHNRFIFEIIPDPVLARIPTMNTSAYPVQVRCSGGWEIESEPEWLNISQIEGMNDVTITVNAKTPNPDESRDRSSDITFISLKHRDAGIDVRRTVNILQRKYTFELSGQWTGNIPAYKSNFTPYVVHLQCSAPWELERYPDWMTPDITSGDGMEDVDIRFNVEVNPEERLRDGEISIRDMYKSNQIGLDVVQDGFVFDGSDFRFEDIEVMNTTSYQVHFNLTAEAPWELVQCPDWVRPSSNSGDGAVAGETVITFVPEANPELKERSDKAVVRSVVNNEEFSVYFTQNPYIFDSSAASFDFKELPSGSENLEIECSGPWTVSGPQWIHFSPSNGQSSQTVTITVDKNVGLVDRSAKCIVTSTINNLTKEIDITQDKYEFDSAPLSYTYGPIDDKEEKFSILCSGAWSAESVPSWASFSQTEGDGDVDGSHEYVTLSVENNLELVSRSAVVYFTSKDNASLQKRVEIIQDAFVFKVDPTSSSFAASSDDIEPVSVKVECTGDWTATASANWINISHKTDTGFELSVDENNSKNSRSGSVTVRSTMNSRTISITVRQSGNDE